MINNLVEYGKSSNLLHSVKLDETTWICIIYNDLNSFLKRCVFGFCGIFIYETIVYTSAAFFLNWCGDDQNGWTILSELLLLFRTT